MKSQFGLKTNEVPWNITDLRRRLWLRPQSITIGILNVLSWHRMGATIKTIELLENISIDVTKIQAIRLSEAGNQEVSKSVLLYRRNIKKVHQFEIGFVRRQKMINS